MSTSLSERGFGICELVEGGEGIECSLFLDLSGKPWLGPRNAIITWCYECTMQKPSLTVAALHWYGVVGVLLLLQSLLFMGSTFLHEFSKHKTLISYIQISSLRPVGYFLRG